jgi:CRP-like cAMP-binding protein
VKSITIKKGQIIQHPGDTNPKVYKVVSGLLRVYALDQKGKEHIFLFGPEGWIVADGVPLNAPAVLFIDALEDSTLEVTDRVQQNLDKITIDPLIKRISVLQNRVIMLLSASAIQRYEHFEETYPSIVQRVPQKMIASYLGITPEALSKVKSQKAKSKL